MTASFIREKSAYLAEVRVTEQILRKISKFQEILGELSMRKQCVPGSFLSAHALEPGNEASGPYCSPSRSYWVVCRMVAVGHTGWCVGWSQ